MSARVVLLARAGQRITVYDLLLSTVLPVVLARNENAIPRYCPGIRIRFYFDAHTHTHQGVIQ